MDGILKDYACTPEREDWGQMIRRELPMYGREDDIRSEFARDYTRILHSLAFRRLKSKTQVFYNAAGNDHICTRIEHVLHVESVSSTIAQYLGLNTELTKSISMAHDLGHAPFGHQGESILDAICKRELGTRFWHEQNGVYIVDNLELLENPEGKLTNLNLTYAVRDGIISHCGELNDNSIRPRKELIGLEQFDEKGKYEAATWEGCVVKLADKIAYLGRDIEDASRLGYLTVHDIEELKTRISECTGNAVNTTVIMHNMITDMADNSSVQKGLSLSSQMSDCLNEIKNFNGEKIYHNPRMNPFRSYSTTVLEALYETLLSVCSDADVIRRIDRMPAKTPGVVREYARFLSYYTEREVTEGVDWSREICDKCDNRKVYSALESDYLRKKSVIDFLAGMTDSYATKAFDELLIG